MAERDIDQNVKNGTLCVSHCRAWRHAHLPNHLRLEISGCYDNNTSTNCFTHIPECTATLHPKRHFFILSAILLQANHIVHLEGS